MPSPEVKTILRPLLFSQGLRGRLEYYVKFRNQAWLEQVSTLLPPAGLILDYGCGDGIFTLYLKLRHPARQLVGFDVDRTKISRAKDLRREGLWFRERLDDVEEDCPQPFDALLCYDVLHHIHPRHHPAVADFASRVLAPGGTLLLKEESPLPRFKAMCSAAVDNLLTWSGVTTGSRVRFFPAEYYRGLFPGFSWREIPCRKWEFRATPLLLYGRRTS